jgi:hypothetical protein
MVMAHEIAPTKTCAPAQYGRTYDKFRTF